MLVVTCLLPDSQTSAEKRPKMLLLLVLLVSWEELADSRLMAGATDTPDVPFDAEELWAFFLVVPLSVLKRLELDLEEYKCAGALGTLSGLEDAACRSGQGRAAEGWPEAAFAGLVLEAGGRSKVGDVVWVGMVCKPG